MYQLLDDNKYFLHEILNNVIEKNILFVFCCFFFFIKFREVRNRCWWTPSKML